MDSHHRISVSDLITRSVVLAYRSAVKNVSPIIERKRKTTFILFPTDPYGESYVGQIIICSDILWPWSPKEVAERSLSALRSFLKWFDREVFPGERKPKLLGITILFVAAITRGAYVRRPEPLYLFLRRCGVQPDFGMVYWLMRNDVKIMTRDIRDFLRWFRSWLRRPEHAINEVFGSFENFLVRARDRVTHAIRFFFSNVSKWLERFAEVRKRSCEDKGIDPYGKLRETIEYLKTVSAMLMTFATTPI